MGPVKSVTEQLNDSATVVKLSYQSTVLSRVSDNRAREGRGASETAPSRVEDVPRIGEERPSL